MAITNLGAMLFALAAITSAEEGPRLQVVGIVARIQRADYEGDRAALQRLHGELAPFAEQKELVSRVRYWQGFALWRRAINGFNEAADRDGQQDDLRLALEEFDRAARSDPAFVDAKIAALSCAGLLAWSMNLQEWTTRAVDLWKEARTMAPGHPRLAWVAGPSLWNIPAARGGGQDVAIESYEKALAAIRNQKPAVADPLEPSWGEPELLMSLAWSNLHRSNPDLVAAARYAREALELVPYWHYVRDILLPQIQKAKKVRQI